jgi:hypothetical protein
MSPLRHIRDVNVKFPVTDRGRATDVLRGDAR